MSDIGRERIAAALRRLADDLGAERRRVSGLVHENCELRAELEQLQGIVDYQRSLLDGKLRLGETMPEPGRVPPIPTRR